MKTSVLGFAMIVFAAGCSQEPTAPATVETVYDVDPTVKPAFFAAAEQEIARVENLTFTKDIAPILFENCTPCHNPGGIGPFPFLTYDDVRDRAFQIAFVTGTRYMPPWLPTPGYVDYHDSRGLTGSEIARIKQWVNEGSVEGDPADMPTPPVFPTGWQLGEPDVILTLENEYILPAGGTDVFRNFVISGIVEKDRWVQAIEFHPGNSKTVHHATIEIDRSHASRRLDAEDPISGFDGMDSVGAQPPDGQFVGWVPGRIPDAGDQSTAWLLPADGDLILQLHMLPTGKPEPIRPTIGLYFTDQAPRYTPVMIRLGSRTIDVPAGEANYRIQDHFRLPIDVRLSALAPHAHYISRNMFAWATLPDGEKRWLLNIEDWDFNWQDDYRFAPAMELPAGTVLSMEYSFDNSADNPQNPYTPPQRIRFGPKTYDEMGDLWIQMLPVDETRRAELQQEYLRYDIVREIDRYEVLTKREPDDKTHWNNLGHNLMRAGNPQQALPAFEHALGLDPVYLHAMKNRAIALRGLGRGAEAEAAFLKALDVDPGDAGGWATLGRIRGSAGNIPGAAEVLRRSVSLDPSQPQVWFDLANAEGHLGRPGAEVTALEHALDLEPNWLQAVHKLARLRATHPDAAIRDPEAAIRLCELGNTLTEGADPVMMQATASAYAAAGRFDEAVDLAVRAARMARELGAPDVADTIESEAALYRAGTALNLRSG
jgi:tetratricopeptide (TPR) repeat protein